jgi:D-alanyl-D-alanine carboxypeptidase
MRYVLVAVLVGAGALLAFMAASVTDRGTAGTPIVAPQSAHPAGRSENSGTPAHVAPLPYAQPIDVRFKLAVKSALLFDARTGRVLWQRRPYEVLPIASLTKMMTALVVVAHARPNARVLITSQAVHFSGSGVGLLPRGKRVPLEPLLYGLLLPSGNDAAIALAQHVAGTQQRFIALMNDRAGAMGLRCTHFDTVSGIVDRGNYSCASDLAVIARAVLRQPLLARIVASRRAILPFPIKAGKLFLYNNNPLLALGYPGADGVKTGYTVAAGSCLVATARRRRGWFGVVLLHSANPGLQAQRLLNAAFATLHPRASRSRQRSTK